MGGLYWPEPLHLYYMHTLTPEQYDRMKADYDRQIADNERTMKQSFVFVFVVVPVVFAVMSSLFYFGVWPFNV